MLFKNRKSKILSLVKSNALQKHNLRSKWVGSSPAEILWRLHTLSKKANYILRGTNIHRGYKIHEAILPLFSALAKLSWSSVSLAWGTMLGKDKTLIRLQSRAMCMIRALEKHNLCGKTGLLALAKRNLTEIWEQFSKRKILQINRHSTAAEIGKTF